MAEMRSNIEHIQTEYRRIDERWLHTQYALMLGLAGFALISELAMYLLLGKLDLISIEKHVYLLKYLLFPTVVDAVLLGAASLVLYSKLTIRNKAYLISLFITGMAFTLYTVHCIFPSLALIFLIPMAVTILYGDLKLTSLVGWLSIAGKTFSDLFLFWDPARKSVFATDGTLIDSGVSLTLLVLFYAVCCILLSTERAKTLVSIHLEEERERFWKESVTDALTRVGNRQAMREAFQQMPRPDDPAPFHLAMLDLDDFKALNDTYGHSIGDQYLRALGDLLLAASSERILPFRFGGDEFCILFYDCSREEVLNICRCLQADFSTQKIQCTGLRVSISVGVARYHPGDTPSILLNKADKALYQAKGEKGAIRLSE